MCDPLSASRHRSFDMVGTGGTHDRTIEPFAKGRLDCPLGCQAYAFTSTLPPHICFEASSLHRCACHCTSDELVVKSLWDSAENFALHKTSNCYIFSWK